jgi:hypothetical protein
MPYAYAAYKRGSIGGAEEGLDPAGFSAWLNQELVQILQGGGQVITFLSDTPEHGRIPVGMATLEFQGKIAYPHALWFPDASARNRLEIAVSFFVELKKDHIGLVAVGAPQEKFFTYLGKYGVLRKVGKLRDWYGDKVHATLFQTVGS